MSIAGNEEPEMRRDDHSARVVAHSKLSVETKIADLVSLNLQPLFWQKKSDLLVP
jgi:hypothetical protein